MAQQHVNYSNPNDGLGDTLRYSQVKAESNFNELYSNKVDKITGKGLSDTNYTQVEKDKLAGLVEGGQVQSSFSEGDALSPAYIIDKPTNTSDFTNDGDGVNLFITDVDEVGNFARSAGEWVDVDEVFVHKTGSETIAGVKTFTDTIMVDVDEATGISVNTQSGIAGYFNSESGVAVYANADNGIAGVFRIDSTVFANIVEFVKGDLVKASVSHEGNFRGNSFIKQDGTASQFLKADGSVDEKSYLVSEMVPTYSAMIALPTVTYTRQIKVLNDENKGIDNAIYQIYPDGVRMWVAATEDV